MTIDETAARREEGTTRSSGTIRVLQVQDKCGHGGAQIQGVQRLLTWWWPALVEAGVEPAICILRPRNRASESFDQLGMPVHYLGRSRLDPLTIVDLVRHVRRNGFQILHCHGYGSTTFGRMAGVVCKVPSIVHEHMIDPKVPAYVRIADRLLRGRASRGIAVSSAVAEFMARDRHLDRGRIEVVENSVPDAFFCRVTADERARVARRIGLEPSLRYVGLVGRLDPVKGQDIFLRAAATVTHSRPASASSRVRFLLVGDGPLLESLTMLSQSLGLADRVDFAGFQVDPRPYLQVMDVLVVSSRSEGSPLALLEGMAAGKPIVATRVGGIPEIVDDGETALLVPPEDPERLADAIGRVLADDALRETLGRAAERRARERHRLVHTVSRLREIYEAVLRESGYR